MEPIYIILMAVLAVAAVLTVYYTRKSTKNQKRVADAAEEDHKLRAKSRLDFQLGRKIAERESVEVELKFFNAGEFPIELKRVVFAWRFNGQSKGRPLERTFERTLHKRKPLEERIRFNEYEFRKDEIREAESLEGGHFYARISGVFRVEYLNVNGKQEYAERSIEALI